MQETQRDMRPKEKPKMKERKIRDSTESEEKETKFKEKI
jgi:hypothetical protein